MTLVIIFALLTVLVLFFGIFGMARGSGFNKKHATKLMSLRVLLQATAFLILIILYNISNKL